MQVSYIRNYNFCSTHVAELRYIMPFMQYGRSVARNVLQGMRYGRSVTRNVLQAMRYGRRLTVPLLQES